MGSCEAEYQNTWWRGCARLRRTKGGRLEAHWDYGEAGSNFKEQAVVPGGRGMCAVFNRSAYHTNRVRSNVKRTGGFQNRGGSRCASRRIQTSRTDTNIGTIVPSGMPVGVSSTRQKNSIAVYRAKPTAASASSPPVS